MSTKGGELASMADHVAQAIHRQAVGPDATEKWIDLDEDERNQFRMIAHAAMGAHDGWLTVNGYVIHKVEKRAALVAPPPAKLLGPDGRPVN